MTNEKTQSFDADQWLATQKKGFGGKVSREVFIAKLKELGQEIEQWKKQAGELTNKNKKLEEQLTTSQTDLTSRDQIITQTQTKLTEQAKISQNKDQELKNLQQRPDITKEKYQELVNNQEKHRDQDLKPSNLPADWETKLAEKDKLTVKVEELEKQLKGVYATYPIIMEEEKPENVKKYIQELEARPTTKQLQQAVQQATEKYQDYKKLSGEEQEAIDNYSAVKSERDQWTSTFLNKKPAEIKAEIDKPSGITLSSEEQKKLNTYESLKTELEQLKKDLVKFNSSQLEPKEINLIAEIQSILGEQKKELEKLITPLQLEIRELKNSQGKIPSNFPLDYETIKSENESLLKIVKDLNPDQEK